MTKRIENSVTYTQTWDAENRLATVTVGGQTTTFYYDADGNRVKQVAGNVTTVYVGAHFEKNLTANTATSYYFAGSARVAMRQGSMVYYLHADHLGSTSLATDASAGVVVPNSATRYYPYGSTRSGGSGLPTPYRFTAQYSAESSLGLYFYNARWYDPALGRFLSADTIVPQPGNPQSLNRYAYTLNNPVKYVDPSGHAADRGGVIGGCGLNGEGCPPPPPPGTGNEIVDELLGQPDATVISMGFSAGASILDQMSNKLKTIYGYYSLDLVSTRQGDIRLFATVPDNRALGGFLRTLGVQDIDDMGAATDWLKANSGESLPAYTPQSGAGMMRGLAYGKGFDTYSAMAYKGGFLNAGGGGGPVALNGFVGYDPIENKPTTNVMGFEVGYSVSFPITGAYVNATYSIPTPLHVKLEGWQIAVCQGIGMCGSTIP